MHLWETAFVLLFLREDIKVHKDYVGSLLWSLYLGSALHPTSCPFLSPDLMCKWPTGLKVILSHIGWWWLKWWVQIWLIALTLIDHSWFTCMIPVRKVTDEATRTRCSSLVRPSKPVMLTGGPSSGTNLVTTEPIIRHKTGNGPAESENLILFCRKLVQNLQ